jgi:glyoxylase-like metal-dependent hydrolase (beta-lactamase superfamily II)
MNIYPIETGNFKLDGGAMFGVVPRTLWSKRHSPDPDGLCSWAMRCMLVEHEGRLILIDNGIGDKQSEKFFSHYHLHGNASMEKSLRSLGVGFDDITDVFMTHLHFDHCGGGIKWNADRTGFEPVFRNATYWSNKAHWKWATEPNAREKASFLADNILPIEKSGQLKFIDLPGDVAAREETDTEFIRQALPGIDLLCVNGHTDAMMIPHIQYKGHTVVFMADLLPSIHHIPLAWVMAYDTRPLQTLREKNAFLERAADEEFVLFFEHDGQNECGLVERTEKGIRLKSTMPFADLG